MKRTFPVTCNIPGFAALLLIQGTAWSINPVSGIYLGGMLGGSYQPNTTLSFVHPLTSGPSTGTLIHSPLVDVAAEVGYRFHYNYRLEAELYFNSAPYTELKLPGANITTGNKVGLNMQGQTYLGAFMVNALYDFITPDSECKVAPFLGLGIGYASIQNSIKFHFNNMYVKNSTLTQTSSTPAAQGIIGLSYFADEFAWFGIDFRYLTTQKIAQFSNARVNISSVNLSVNGTFDCG